MKSLYRKYRPLRLEDVVGQPQVTEPLARAIKEKSFGHAYLFTGPRGTGKTSVARIFAHAINGFTYSAEDNYVDIIEIDAASNNGVDNIRDLSERAAIAPTEGQYKVYIIDEVHMLSKAAFNALLKTLEEPPAHVIFVMATTDAYKVPVTITSRAQVFTFHLSDPATMQAHLAKIAKAEKIKIDADALELVVEQGGGSFRDALSLLDQIAVLGGGQRITRAKLVESLGLPETTQLDQLLESYAAGDLVQIQEGLRELLAAGIKPETIAEHLMTQIMQNPTPTTLSLLARLPSVSAPFAEAKLLVACAPEIVRPALTVAAPAEPVTGAPAPEANAKQEPAESTSVEPAPATKAKTPTAKPKAPAKKSATTVAETTPAPAPTDAAPQAVAAAVHFNWQSFVDSFQNQHLALYNQLQKVDFVAHGGVLHLFPKKSIVRTILSAENNVRLLNQNLSLQKFNLVVEIHDPDDDPSSITGAPSPTAAQSANATDASAAPLADKISEISAIMGKIEEVTEDGDPFAQV